MKACSLLLLVLVVAAAVPPAAALPDEFVIPASAHAAGAAGSFWMTDLELFNAGSADLVAVVRFLADGSVSDPTLAPHREIHLPSRAGLRVMDVVGDLFGLESGSGALSLDVPEASQTKLAVSSRTFNQADDGTFGLTVPALTTADELGKGDQSVLFAVADPGVGRTNVGVYALADATVDWRLLGPNGNVRAERTGSTYLASTSTRHNDVVRALFEVEPQPGDVLQLMVLEGRILPWASRVDDRTNDGDFVVGRRLRSNEAPRVEGLDLDGDAHPEILDLDGDATLDQVLALSASYPAPVEVRLLVTDPEGVPVTFAGVDLPSAVTLEPASGMMKIWPAASLSSIGSLRVKVSDGIDTVVISIPISIF